MNYKKIAASITLIMLIIATIAVVTLFHTDKESIYFIIGSGVLASIIASLIFTALSSFLLREPTSERDELKELIGEFQVRQLHGVVKICQKFEQKPEYWNKLIADSSSQLDMLGHAFTTWTHYPHADSFAEKIRLIAKNHGQVRIVILDPEGENTQRLSSRFGRNYSDRVQETVSFFKSKIYAKLSKAQKKRVVIKLEKESDVSYMYINNGSMAVVSPYYTLHSDSKDNLVIELDSKSKFLNSYASDFEEVFKNAGEIKI
jgi:hypothetical protein